MHYLKSLSAYLFSVYVFPITLTLATIFMVIYLFGSKRVKVEIINQRNSLLKQNPLWAVVTLLVMQTLQYINILLIIKG